MAQSLFPSIVPTADDDQEEAGEQHASEPTDWETCPGCDEYEGDHVAQHARNAHPELYDELTDTEA